MVALRAASRGVPVSYAMMTQFATLSPEAHIDEAVQTLLQTSQGEFPVVDGTGKPVGVLGRADLIRAIKTRGAGRPRRRCHGAEMPTISHRGTLEQAFKLLQQKSAQAVGVTDAAASWWPGHQRNHRRNDDVAGSAARRRPYRPMGPSGRGLNHRISPAVTYLSSRRRRSVSDPDQASMLN